MSRMQTDSFKRVCWSPTGQDGDDEGAAGNTISGGLHPDMEIQSSQQATENATADKKRGAEGASVLQEQHRAVEEAMNKTIRTFRQESVLISTANNEQLAVRMWVSDQEPPTPTKKKMEVFRCDVCGKEFDKNQKLLLHARFHKSA